MGYVCVTGIDERIYDCYKEALLQGDSSLSPRSFKPIEGQNNLYLSMVCVDKSQQNKGVGKALVKECIESLTKIKKYDFRIIAVCTTEKGQKLLLNSGFTKIQDFNDFSEKIIVEMIVTK